MIRGRIDELQTQPVVEAPVNRHPAVAEPFASRKTRLFGAFEGKVQLPVNECRAHSNR